MKVILVVAVLMLVVLLILLQKRRRVKALKVLQSASLKQVNQALSTCLSQVQTENFDGKKYHIDNNAELLADVWGKGVMAFEYSLPGVQLSVQDLPAIRQALGALLTQYAHDQRIVGYQEEPLFVVSDIWVLADVLHLDISYVVNRATSEYLHDIAAPEHENN